MNSRTWQRLKHGSHFCHLPSLNLVWTRKDALRKFIHNCFLPRCLLLCGHIRYVFVFRHASFRWTARKPIDLVDHLAQNSGDSNGPEIVVATAAFVEKNTFNRKLFHILACITWLVCILSRCRERREKYVDGHSGKQIGPESDSFKRCRRFTPSWYERRS